MPTRRRVMPTRRRVSVVRGPTSAQQDPKAIAEAIIAEARAAAARVAAARQAFLEIGPWICGECTYCHIDVSEMRFLACAQCLAEKPSE